MKTKIFLLAGMCLLILASGAGMGCSCMRHQSQNIDEPITPLSQLTDQEIRVKIDTLYNRAFYITDLSFLRDIYVLQVYQNELLLRQEWESAKNRCDTPSLSGIWYSTHLMINPKAREYTIGDYKKGIPVYPYPFAEYTWSYDFQDNGMLVITTNDGNILRVPYSFNEGVLEWGRTDEPIITETLLIFRRAYGYWILSRTGEVGTRELTTDEGMKRIRSSSDINYLLGYQWEGK